MKIVLAITAVVGCVVGYVLMNSYEIGICYANLATSTFDVSCHLYFNKVGQPLFYGMGALALVFFVLVFIPTAFAAWKRFAIWFVPLAALLFISYPEPGAGDLMAPYPEQVYRVVSVLYVLISFAIIAWAVRHSKVRK